MSELDITESDIVERLQTFDDRLAELGVER